MFYWHSDSSYGHKHIWAEMSDCLELINKNIYIPTSNKFVYKHHNAQAWFLQLNDDI